MRAGKHAVRFLPTAVVASVLLHRRDSSCLALSSSSPPRRRTTATASRTMTTTTTTTTTTLPAASFDDDAFDDDAIVAAATTATTAAPPARPRPRWIPMELAELASEDARMTPSEYVRTHADVEAYTSCDDDGDDLHECDAMSSYMGPTKWLHLTDEASNSVSDVHLSVWRDVWARPRMAIELADSVSRECMRCVRARRLANLGAASPSSPLRKF